MKTISIYKYPKILLYASLIWFFSATHGVGEEADVLFDQSIPHDLIVPQEPHLLVDPDSVLAIDEQFYCYFGFGSDFYHLKLPDNNYFIYPPVWSKGIGGNIGCRYLKWGLQLLVKQSLIVHKAINSAYDDVNRINLKTAGSGIDYLLYQSNNKLTAHLGLLLYNLTLDYSGKSHTGDIRKRHTEGYIPAGFLEITYFVNSNIALSCYYQEVFDKRYILRRSLSMRLNFYSRYQAKNIISDNL